MTIDIMAKGRERAKEIKSRFDAAHRDGMSALKTGDYDKFDDAVQRKRAAIEDQADVLAEVAAETKDVATAAASRRPKRKK
ncbi:MAG TPA: hypothetical protein VEL28_17660 [Candidatus Binatia bacterium]|nr:hypothetical protein [Candidatus Binatia bacterium]